MGKADSVCSIELPEPPPEPAIEWCDVQLSPSDEKSAPFPMAALERVAQCPPVFGATPKNPMPQTSPPELAGTLSGRTLYNALLISSSIVDATLPQRKQGAVGPALYTQPLGAITVTGLLEPSLAGSSGLVNAFTAILAEDRVVPHKPFMGALCSGSEPVKSMVILLPLTVTITLIFIGLSRSMPLLSMKSSAVQVPSDIFSIASLVRGSLWSYISLTHASIVSTPYFFNSSATCFSPK